MYRRPDRKLAALAAIVIAIAGFVSGCATIETGAIDYRRAEKPVNVTSRIANYPTKDCLPQESTKGLAPRPEVCPPMLGSRLFRKNLSRGVGIGENDVYSIRLDYAYMDFVNELKFTPGNIFIEKSPFRSKSEIVVLARAFEFEPVAENSNLQAGDGTGAISPQPSATSENAFLDLTMPSLNSARVVYYSPDVEGGQPLNLSNIPVIGPVKYGGRPVGVQVIVLELDRVSEEMKGLLSSLASLGQTAGAIPTGGAANILTELGKSLLESNQDDIVFEYRFVLDQSGNGDELRFHSFEEGRYVLRRLHHREKDIVWRNLELDHNTGQLFEVSRSGTSLIHRPYRSETYFTLNVINHGSGAKEAAYAHQRLSELRTAIAATTTAERNDLTPSINEIDDLSKQVRGDVMVRDLTALWGSIRADAMRVARDTPPDEGALDANQCSPTDRSSADRNLSAFNMLQKVAKFKLDWTAAVDANTSGKTVFGDAEKLRVAGNVGGFFVTLNDLADSAGNEIAKQEAQIFVSAESFNTLVNGDFADATLDYASLMKPRDCASSVATGFATWNEPTP